MSPECCRRTQPLKEAHRSQAASASAATALGDRLASWEALLLCLLLTQAGPALLSLLSTSRLDSCEPGLKALANATHFQPCPWALPLGQPSSLCLAGCSEPGRGGGEGRHPPPPTTHCTAGSAPSSGPITKGWEWGRGEDGTPMRQGGSIRRTCQIGQVRWEPVTQYPDRARGGAAA